MFRRLLKKCARARTIERKPSRVRLILEHLEDRLAPTVVTANWVNTTVTEGMGGAYTWSLSVDHPSTQLISVDFATADGTGAAGTDYTGTSGTAYVQPGQMSSTPFSIFTLDDNVGNEVSPETFTMNYSNAVNATFSGNASVLLSITEDLDPVPPNLVINASCDMPDS